MTSTVTIAIIGIFAATFGGSGFWQFIASKSRKKTPMELMLMAIGRDRLNFLCKKYIKQGYVPEDECESFYEMGDAYIGAEGNSKVKHLYLQAKELPVRVE